MKESDWKKFTNIKDHAIEKFCSEALNESEEITSDKSMSSYEKYLHLYKLFQNRDEDFVLMFDDHSRSKATIQLLAMRVRDLVDESLVSKLSIELQESTDPKRFRD